MYAIQYILMLPKIIRYGKGFGQAEYMLFFEDCEFLKK